MGKYTRISVLYIIGFCHIIHVLSVLPFITDNSSEGFGVEGDEWLSSPNTVEERWANSAYNYIQNLSCNSVFFTTGKECRKLLQIPKSAMSVHIAPRREQGRYRAMVPDEILNRKETFNGVIVVDPYPKANFGHLVIVFVVKQHPRELCKLNDGIYVGEFLSYVYN